MNTSTITKSALALALGLCASAALAVSNPVITEDFSGDAFDGGVDGVTTNKLTWADPGEYSYVSDGQKLVVDATTDQPTSATIDSTVATNFNGAIEAAGRAASFTAKVKFTPATETPEIGGNDLKFALYAKAAAGSTHLMVLAKPTSAGVTNEIDTGFSIDCSTDTTVSVNFTAENTFEVAVGSAAAVGPYYFANNGTIAKVEFAGNGDVDDIGFSYDYASIDLSWPTTISVASYTINGNAGDALTAGDGSKVVYGDVGDAIVLTIQNADGVQKTFTGTIGTDATVGNAAYAYTWADYLGDAVDGAYEIDNLTELKLFQKGCATNTASADRPVLATAGLTFKLTADIELDAAWPGIGLQNGKDHYKETVFENCAFRGTFDGQDHTISGFQMVGGNLDYCGFFNSAFEANIANFKIQYAGALFAADTSASSSESGATFVGVAKKSTLQNLTSLQKDANTGVTCRKGFGGIVGYTTCGTTIDSCTNNVNITSSQPNKAGGIAMILQQDGTVTATNVIRNCQNNGTTSGSAEHGGLAGYVQAPLLIDGCESTVADQLLNHYSNVITVQGVNKAKAGYVSYIKHSGQSPADFDGLHFATVSGDDATFVYDGDLALNGEYKVMSAGATATFNFTTTGTIAFDEALVAPTYAITGATGLTVTPSTSGTVKTYTATVTQYAVTVSGDTSNLTATWTVNGNTVSAPATLNHGDSYSVTFAPATGYKFSDGQTTTFSGTATAEVAITAPLVEVEVSYSAGDKPVEGEGGSSYTISADEATYLNTLVGTKGADAVETALDTISAENFSAAVLLNQDITETGAGTYSFDVTKITKSGTTVTVSVKLTRSGTRIGGINGTLVLQTCATPTGTYTDAQTLDIDGTAFAGDAAEATANFTFTGVTGDSNKFFKAVIR